MLGFLRKAIGDFFLGSKIKDVKGSKRINRHDTIHYLDKIELGNAPLTKRSMSQYGAVGEYDPNLKTILIVDDCNINSLYGADFQIIKNVYGVNIYKEFNVYQVTGSNCGVEAIKLINEIPIDYAILDLTLGNFCEVKNHPNKFIEIDGVDIGIYLKNKFPEIKIIFSSAHLFNKRYPEFQEYLNKFESATGLKFKDHYINKLCDSRTDEFFNFLGYYIGSKE